MPFSRRFSGRRRGFGRRRFVSRRRPNVRSLARRISSVARRDRPNYLVFDDVNSDTGTGAGPFSIPGGGGDYRFLMYNPIGFSSSSGCQFNSGLYEGDIRGNNVRLVSVTIRGNVLLPTVSPDVSNYVRVIVYWDAGWGGHGAATINNNIPTPQNGILGAWTGQGSTSPYTIGATPYTGYNVSTVGGRGKRYTILKDRVFTLSSEGKQAQPFFWKIKLNKMLGFTNSATGAMNQCVGIYAVSDSTLPANPLMTFCARFCYTC